MIESLYITIFFFRIQANGEPDTKVYKMQHCLLGYGFQVGPSKKRETTRNPQVILPRSSLIEANYRTHTYLFLNSKNWYIGWKLYKMQHCGLGYGFQVGPSKEERDDRKPSGDFTPSQPSRSQLPHTHTHSYILEYWMKIVQNAALWTRLRFSGGAIKRRERRPETLRWFYPVAARSKPRLPHTLIEHIHSG